ncbi:thermonuclease family protein [Weizmannia coagulans]|uniref:TNase-like domain-containing protein n=2 Tax=Heyndrickxia TaxID=2837504 RepID=A0AAN0WDS1_HEYCO|nr:MULTISPECIES: thermonuclease family protein [Heyndrickxia]AJO24826.1 hypothetical protein SB48_HM08orf06364 [Heyndrickxia coagulans]AKN53741.1 Phage-encoded chromosome degrading nuclease YokF [Heyndrickxia coagulans]ATW84546.1 endonuclease [Heyndrickxia coagulans]MCU6438335.1 endonuclease [Heyndrickxia coagulans]MDL4843794.1 thermonuclease family protein [Heyndrickxia coagulans]
MKKGGTGCLGFIIVLFLIGLAIQAVKFVFTHIYGIFLILALVSLVLIFVGLFKPNVAFWSKKKTKKSAGIGYLILTIVFFILFGISAPNQDTATKKSNVDTQTASSKVQDEDKDKADAPSSSKKSDESKTEDNGNKKDDSKKTEDDASNSSKASTTAATADKKETSKSSSSTNTTKKPASSSNQQAVTLVETVDGDTIKVNYNGKVETVRYLLVDTPEEKKPGTCVQPFAESAYNKNKQLVNSGKLTLEFETNGDKYDKYGRLLAYVYVNGKSVQEELLKGGYARVAYIYNPPYKYLSKYESDENAAKSRHLNIWSDSGFVTDSGFNGCAKASAGTSTASSRSSSSTTRHSTSSGSSNSSSSSATSAPASSGATEIFANCTELRKKYPNGVPKGHPAYQEKMDRDHDNYACER